MIKAAIVLGVLAIVAALLAGGRYTVTQQGSIAYVVDRFTGAVRFCVRDECLDVPNKNPQTVVNQDQWPGVKRDPATAPQAQGRPWAQYQKQ